MWYHWNKSHNRSALLKICYLYQVFINLKIIAFFCKGFQGLVNHGGTTGIKVIIYWPYYIKAMLSTAGFLKINLDILVIYVNYCIYIMKPLDFLFFLKSF